MRSKLVILIVLIGILAISITNPFSFSNNFNSIWKKNGSSRIIIQYKDDVAKLEKSSIEFAYGFHEKKHLRIIDAYVYEYVGEPTSLILSLNNNSSIEFAELDHQIQAASKIPNDPYFDKQWALHNMGQTGGVPDIDIDAPEAWEISTGNSEAIVAVIDTGIDYGHEDLKENIWVNVDEIIGNRIDDDENGYIDDYFGINAITSISDPWDDNGHGTHCAGIIGAVGNNEVGISGVCWDVQLMALKCLNNKGTGYVSDAIECIQYAVEKGAQIINLPWGTYDHSIALRQTIEIVGEEIEALFIVPAGNDGLNLDIYSYYPASYELSNQIVVGSLDHLGNISSFSNIAQNCIHLYAPGEKIFSTYLKNSYCMQDGTSMASALITGLISSGIAKNSEYYNKSDGNLINSNLFRYAQKSFSNSNIPKKINYMISPSLKETMPTEKKISVNQFEDVAHVETVQANRVDQISANIVTVSPYAFFRGYWDRYATKLDQDQFNSCLRYIREGLWAHIGVINPTDSIQYGILKTKMVYPNGEEHLIDPDQSFWGDIGWRMGISPHATQYINIPVFPDNPMQIDDIAEGIYEVYFAFQEPFHDNPHLLVNVERDFIPPPENASGGIYVKFDFSEYDIPPTLVDYYNGITRIINFLIYPEGTGTDPISMIDQFDDIMAEQRKAFMGAAKTEVDRISSSHNQTTINTRWKNQTVYYGEAIHSTIQLDRATCVLDVKTDPGIVNVTIENTSIDPPPIIDTYTDDDGYNHTLAKWWYYGVDKRIEPEQWFEEEFRIGHTTDIDVNFNVSLEMGPYRYRPVIDNNGGVIDYAAWRDDPDNVYWVVISADMDNLHLSGTGIQDIYTQGLELNTWGQVSIDIIAPTNGNYYLKVFNDNLLPPDWEWASTESSLRALSSGDSSTFSFNIRPNTSEETFQFWLYKQSWIPGIFFVIDKVTHKLLVNEINTSFAISNPRVYPNSGSITDSFMFRVDYHDGDGDIPTVSQIILDGDTHNVILETGNASSGTYVYGPVTLSEGSHDFFFHFENAVNGSSNSETVYAPYIYPGGGQETYSLSLSANPNPVQEDDCTVITATLRDNLGDPVSGKVLTFATGFPPGIFSGAPPPGCSGPTYEPGNSGTTDTNGQVKKYFRSTISGTAIITVESETGEAKNLNLSVSSIPGDASAGIYVRSAVAGSIYDVEASVTKGASPADHEWVTMTTSHGQFYYNGSPTGSQTFREQTDSNGEFPGASNDLEIRVSNYTGYIVVTLLYEVESYETATTFLCSSSPIGDTLPLYLITTLNTANRVYSVSWSHDGAQLYAGTYSSRYLYGWNTSDWSQRFLNTGLDNYLLSSAVKADNARIVLGENGGEIEIFDSNGTYNTGWDHCADVPGIDWVGDYIFALIEAGDTTTLTNHGCYRYNQSGSYTAINTFNPDTSRAPRTNLVYNPNRNIFAYAMEYEIGSVNTSVLFIHNGSNPFSYQQQVLYEPAAYHLDISQSGNKIAVVGNVRGATIVDTNSLGTFTITEAESNIYDLCEYIGSSDNLAVGGDGLIKFRIYDPTGRIVFDPGFTQNVHSMDYSEAKGLLALGLGNGDILIYGYDTESPEISNVSVLPSTYSIGTIFDISCDLVDPLSGLNASTAKSVIRDSGDNIVEQITMAYGGGDSYSCQWNSSGISAGIYFIGIYVEDNAGNYSEVTNARLLDFTSNPPVAPTLNDCTALSATEISVSWNDNSDNEDGFIIERSTNGSDWTQAGTRGSNVESFSDSGLNTDTLYYYRVKSYNVDGESSSNVLSARTYKAMSITVQTPNGGEQYQRGSSNLLYWTSTGQIDEVRIILYKGGSFNQEIINSTDNSGIYLWYIPGDVALGNDYRIQVEKADDSIINDISDSNFAIIAPGTMTINPTAGLDSSGNVGGPFSPSQVTYTLENTGDASINWVASRTQTWITLSSTGGTLSPGADTTVTVSINANANGLGEGTYNDTVTITNTTNGIGNTSRPVSLTVNATPGVLSVAPEGGLSSSGQVGGPFSPSNIIYTLENTGGAPLNWTASNSQPWVTLSSNGGYLSPGANTTVTVSINANANGLSVGIYNDTVSFTNTTNGIGNASRPVSLTVVDLPRLSVTPGGGFSSSGQVGGPFSPSNIIYTLENTGGASLNWIASNSQSWVTLSSAGGSLSPGASTTVTVSINANANGLSEGTYNDSVTFNNTINGIGNTSRLVSLTVVDLPRLSVTPTAGLISSGTTGGPFSPSNIIYTLQNTGGTSLNWTAANSQSWVSLSSNGGSLSPGASTTVTVSINANANGLGAGTYNDTVTFTNTTNGIGNTSRSVTLTAIPPGGLLVTPGDGLNSSGIVGGPFSPSNKVYTLENTGGASINWVASNSQPWVTLSSNGGSLSSGGSTAVTVSINTNANALGSGEYNDTVTFTNTTNGIGNTSRLVNLMVIFPPTLSITPAGGLSSSGQVGGPFSPSNIIYTLENTGGSLLNWAASNSQPWVTLSSNGGTLSPGASTAVTVFINAYANTLNIGTYNDAVIFTNATNGIGNTSRNVTLMVGPIEGITVTPGDGLTSSGIVGGPFSPQNKVYTLENTGGTSINWLASKTQDWVTLSSTGGTITPYATTTVTVQINSNANGLSAETYNDIVTFTNTTNGIGNTSRPVSLTVSELPTLQYFVFDGHDFDGDGTSDISLYRPTYGMWYIKDGTSQQWGAPGDIPAQGNYDLLDTDTEIAIFRPTDGLWYISGISTTQWGTSGDIPVPHDYNGDDITDLAVWRPSDGVWYINGVGYYQWGQLGDYPVPGDYNGDGMDNIAVWRPAEGTWYISGVGYYQWGTEGDIPVPADYNGDGRIDLAVFRPAQGIWYIQYMGGGTAAIQWGMANDVPVPGDYDGNGTTEVAIWRPSNGLWYIYGNGTYQWGTSGDIPLVR